MEKVANESIMLINGESEEGLSELALEHHFALKALEENPGILGNYLTFEKLVYVLNGMKPVVDVWEPPTILMIAKAIKYLQKIEQLPNEWHGEVVEYIAQIAHEEGWVDMPEVLQFAQKELKALQPQELDLDEEAKKNQAMKHEPVIQYLSTI
jgi:hypothetical protein